MHIFRNCIFNVLYIWFRFIRERLPKDIPFSLTLLTLIFLLFICSIFVYVILRLINPKSPNILTHKFIIFYTKIVKFLYKFDQILKENQWVKTRIESILLFLLKKLKPDTLYSKGEIKYILYFLLPRIILLLVFLIDVFYFLKISIINLLVSYFIYSIKTLALTYLEILKDYLIEIISKDDDLNADYYLDPSTISYDDYVITELDQRFHYLTIQHFIDLQCTAIMFDHTPYHYKCFHKSQRQDLINLCPQKFEIFLENYIESLLQSLLDIKIIFETINFLEKRKTIQNLRIIIYSLYLISWLYILFVSLHTFHFTALERIFLQCFQDYIEPFSGFIL